MQDLRKIIQVIPQDHEALSVQCNILANNPKTVWHNCVYRKIHGFGLVYLKQPVHLDHELKYNYCSKKYVVKGIKEGSD
jgi:hypothetical protein